MKYQVTYELPSMLPEAQDFFDCIEHIEEIFGIEFSCGDGKFFSDIDLDSPGADSYDGKVDSSLCRKNGRLIKNPIISCTYDPASHNDPSIEEFIKCSVKAK